MHTLYNSVIFLHRFASCNIPNFLVLVHVQSQLSLAQILQQLGYYEPLDLHDKSV